VSGMRYHGGCGDRCDKGLWAIRPLSQIEFERSRLLWLWLLYLPVMPGQRRGHIWQREKRVGLWGWYAGRIDGGGKVDDVVSG